MVWLRVKKSQEHWFFVVASLAHDVAAISYVLDFIFWMKLFFLRAYGSQQQGGAFKESGSSVSTEWIEWHPQDKLQYTLLPDGLCLLKELKGTSTKLPPLLASDCIGQRKSDSIKSGVMYNYTSNFATKWYCTTQGLYNKPGGSNHLHQWTVVIVVIASTFHRGIKFRFWMCALRRILCVA